MLTENVKFEFVEFQPEPETKNLIATVVDRIYLSAPSDSFLKLAIKKSRGAIQASCRITSQVGSFVVVTSGQNPVRALQRLEQRMKNQLDSWKSNRFSRSV